MSAPLPFQHRMSPLQTALGWLYLPLHMIVLPLGLGAFVLWFAPELTEIEINLAYAGVGMAFVLTVMFSFLRRSFDAFLDRPGFCLWTAVLGFVANYALSIAIGLLLLLLPQPADNPNDSFILEMASRNRGAVLAINAILAPIVEEVLFRGVVFGSLQRCSRMLAYVLSSALFSLGHVWQYAAAWGDPAVLLYALRYLPVSVVLAWCYERSGSIWTTIIFHMAFNGISFAVLG